MSRSERLIEKNLTEHVLFLGPIIDSTKEESIVKAVSQLTKLPPSHFEVLFKRKTSSAYLLTPTPEASKLLQKEQFLHLEGQKPAEMQEYRFKDIDDYTRRLHEKLLALKSKASGHTQKDIMIREIQRPKEFLFGKRYEWLIVAENESSLAYTIIKIELKAGSYQGFSINHGIKKHSSKTLETGKKLSVQISYAPDVPIYGNITVHLIFTYQDATSKIAQEKIKSHAIVLNIEANKSEAPVDNSNDHLLGQIDEIDRKIVPSQASLSRASFAHFHTPTETPWLEQLPEYELPDEIRRNVDTLFVDPQVNPWKSDSNIRDRFHRLLWIEEAFLLRQIRERHDLSKVQFTKVYDTDVKDAQYLHRLVVPNLSEHRPSLLPSDVIYAWLDGTTDVEYEGIIHQVEKDSILVIFCPEFDSIFNVEKCMFNVRFRFPRDEMRHMHRAVDRVSLDVIRPVISEIDVSFQESLYNRNDFEFHNSLIEKDAQQKKLVQLMVGLTEQPLARKPPALLIGPFGTGKTTVLIESIICILKRSPNSKILIAARTNSGADIFVSHLFKLGVRPDQMFRLMPFHRSPNSVPTEVFQYTMYDTQKRIFDIPPLAEIIKKRIVITTTGTSSNLYSIGVKPGVFTHVIIDEGGQITEPQTFIPLLLASPKTLVVLSGDPKQIGPDIRSPQAKHHKLHRSLMEALANENEIYRSPSLFKLELHTNYRCHPEIMKLPSKWFYNDELKCNGVPEAWNTVRSWSLLQGFPLKLIGIRGRQQKEGKSPSYYNIEEIYQIKELIIQALNEAKKLREEDISVLCPTFAQVKHMRNALRSVGYREIRVGSVDDMQGREKALVFISLVYTSIDENSKHRNSTGFISDEKRLNTAFTRAAGALVVVGNPEVMFRDSYWTEFAQYCKEHNSYIGSELSDFKKPPQIVAPPPAVDEPVTMTLSNSWASVVATATQNKPASATSTPGATTTAVPVTSASVAASTIAVATASSGSNVPAAVTGSSGIAIVPPSSSAMLPTVAIPTAIGTNPNVSPKGASNFNNSSDNSSAATVGIDLNLDTGLTSPTSVVGQGANSGNITTSGSSGTSSVPPFNPWFKPTENIAPQRPPLDSSVPFSERFSYDSTSSSEIPQPYASSNGNGILGYQYPGGFGINPPLRGVNPTPRPTKLNPGAPEYIPTTDIFTTGSLFNSGEFNGSASNTSNTNSTTANNSSNSGSTNVNSIGPLKYGYEDPTFSLPTSDLYSTSSLFQINNFISRNALDDADGFPDENNYQSIVNISGDDLIKATNGSTCPQIYVMESPDGKQLAIYISLFYHQIKGDFTLNGTVLMFTTMSRNVGHQSSVLYSSLFGEADDNLKNLPHNKILVIPPPYLDSTPKVSKTEHQLVITYDALVRKLQVSEVSEKDAVTEVPVLKDIISKRKR